MRLLALRLHEESERAYYEDVNQLIDSSITCLEELSFKSKLSTVV